MSQALPLVLSEPLKHAGGGFSSSRSQRWREVFKIAGRRLDLPSRTKAFEGTASGKGGKKGHRAPAVCDLDGLASFHAPQQFTGSLS